MNIIGTMVSPKSLKNLEKRKPFGLGRPAKAGPGRPKKPDWTADLEALAMQPKERLPFLRRMLHKYPVDAMHYLAGKPLEQIKIEGTITTAIDPATLEAAAAVAQRLTKGPLSLPSPAIKVAPESIVSEENSAKGTVET